MAPETLHQSILDLLNSAASASKPVARCPCGAAMEYRDTQFFYEGQSWNLKLPVCPRCQSAPRVLMHDA